MAISKDKKKEIIKKIKEAVSGAATVVFVNFRGVTVKEVMEMRRTLRAAGVGYYVAKKTLVGRVLEDEKFSGERPEIVEGELALAYGADMVAPAREIYNFQKKYEDRIKILGGVFERKYETAEGITALAKIPSLSVLIGRFVNLINSPLQRFVVALSEISRKK
ncbi:MAG: 50S ribosomal protein L10 [Candidatus Taylorbacteria bacterium]|nr:50S ribosomal protein L10 [Candidatus Taylorbacteria bacterium]